MDNRNKDAYVAQVWASVSTFGKDKGRLFFFLAFVVCLVSCMLRKKNKCHMFWIVISFCDDLLFYVVIPKMYASLHLELMCKIYL